MRTLRLCLTLLCLVLGGAAAAQQQDGGFDYGPWEGTAERAEEALQSGQVSVPTLEALRTEIAGFRQRFIELQDTEAARIQTLRNQIDALGPPPEDGDEPAEIAQRRAELNRQLQQTSAPAVAAGEAYRRADGLIREIGAQIRERTAAELLSRGPPPVNPVLWPGAVQDMMSSLRALFVEVDDAWLSPARRGAFLSNLPAVILLSALGILLVARGGAWAESGTNWLRERTRRGTGIWRFMVSLGQIFLPLLGVIALLYAAQTSGLVFGRIQALLVQVPIWLTIFFYVRWLAGQTFSRDDDVATLPIETPRRAEARAYLSVLALLLVLRRVRIELSTFDAHGPETVAVLSFPLILLTGIVMFRLGQILSRARFDGEGEEALQRQDAMHLRLRVARFLGKLVMFVSAGAPVMAAAGYDGIAMATLYPMVATLILSGTVLVLLRVNGDLYRLITDRPVSEAQSLIPVLVGFLIVLSALPLLALAWGARVADLTELWTIFTTGFELGETRVSPGVFLTLVAVFVIGFVLTRLLQSSLRSAVLPKTKMDIGGRNAVVAGTGYLGIFLAALAAFGAAGIDMSSLALVAGALSVGIGFGLQNIVQNFVSGIILLIERPISEGDWVKVGDNMGFVKDISVRSTRIETFDHFDVIVPNGDFISGVVTNYTRGNTIGRLIVPISVAYGSDTRKVESILLGIAREHPLVMMNPAPFIYFSGYQNSALNFEIRVYLIDVLEILAVQTEMNHQIAERFAAEGIEIPFPQRDIWLRNPETLVGHGEPAHRAFAGEGQDVRAMPQTLQRRRGVAGDPE
ncbi:DUF3772 domain-containing protein [Roseivivax isoporae]|uniref:Small mechanosensitive ion channel protein MscS n=1 Tax=Roseivivax isoporae LMG 25204 TaxID=1449351 RepID=X7FF78_9RHOB|nr:DUF3772 domain-containing protein [Roseivivax isoporae]ETX30731.1 small mechanosensitive ion channel protein MscS [Roseivivax isoporae LMG 25204]